MKKGMRILKRVFLFLFVIGVTRAVPYVLNVVEQEVFSQAETESWDFFSDLQEDIQISEEQKGYYFQQLNEEEQMIYIRMLKGVQKREETIYLTLDGNQNVERVYHAMRKDHPELFWIHHKEQVSIITYSNSNKCEFMPNYLYTDAEVLEVQQVLEGVWQEVDTLIPEGADTYEKIKTVYTYLIDTMDYVSSEHDQNIAGAFWKKQAVCAGYAGAMQYLLNRMDIFCICVEGDMKDSPEGHAWNIVEIDGNYYYVDATNGDQPEFLEGDATQMAEHKTIIYDYLCPFPEEYETQYNISNEFLIPDCTQTDKNFYVLNQGCFDTYESGQLYDYCCMRLDYGAAVVRFKFRTQEAYERAYVEWIENAQMQTVAQYYMEKYGLQQIEYHYGLLEHLKTMYFMF